jgi:hypothetical protein
MGRVEKLEVAHAVDELDALADRVAPLCYDLSCAIAAVAEYGRAQHDRIATLAASDNSELDRR